MTKKYQPETDRGLGAFLRNRSAEEDTLSGQDTSRSIGNGPEQAAGHSTVGDPGGVVTYYETASGGGGEGQYRTTLGGGPPPGVDATLAERGSRYGDFNDNAAISQELKRIIEGSPSFARMSDLHKEGLTMIAQKIARILNGDPNYADNWHDIQGYAKLVEDRLPK